MDVSIATSRKRRIKRRNELRNLLSSGVSAGWEQDEGIVGLVRQFRRRKRRGKDLETPDLDHPAFRDWSRTVSSGRASSAIHSKRGEARFLLPGEPRTQTVTSRPTTSLEGKISSKDASIWSRLSQADPRKQSDRAKGRDALVRLTQPRPPRQSKRAPGRVINGKYRRRGQTSKKLGSTVPIGGESVSSEGIVDLPGVSIGELRRRAALALPVPFEQRLREKLRVSGFLDGGRHMKWTDADLDTGSRGVVGAVGGQLRQPIGGKVAGRPGAGSQGALGTAGGSRARYGALLVADGSDKVSSGELGAGSRAAGGGGSGWKQSADTDGVVWLQRQKSVPRGKVRGAGMSGTRFSLDVDSWVRETDRIGTTDGVQRGAGKKGSTGGSEAAAAAVRAAAASVRPGLEMLREGEVMRRRRLGFDWGERYRAMQRGERQGGGGGQAPLPPRVAGMKAALARLAAASTTHAGPAIQAARRRWLAYKRKEARRRRRAAKGKRWLWINKRAVQVASDRVGAWRRHSMGAVDAKGLSALGLGEWSEMTAQPGLQRGGVVSAGGGLDSLGSWGVAGGPVDLRPRTAERGESVGDPARRRKDGKKGRERGSSGASSPMRAPGWEEDEALRPFSDGDEPLERPVPTYHGVPLRPEGQDVGGVESSDGLDGGLGLVSISDDVQLYGSGIEGDGDKGDGNMGPASGMANASALVGDAVRPSVTFSLGTRGSRGIGGNFSGSVQAGTGHGSSLQLAVPITAADKVAAAQARLRRVGPTRERAAAIQHRKLVSRVEQAKWTMTRGKRNADRRKAEEAHRHRQRQWLVLVALLAFLRRTVHAAEPALEEVRTLRIMEKYVFLIQSTFRKYARRMKQRLQKGAWVRVRKQSAALIARFLRDHSGLQQGLARYVTLFRGKVRRVQKLFRGYMVVTEGRMHALSLHFDAMVAARFSQQVESASNQYKALLHQYQRTTLGDALRRSQQDRKHRMQLMRAGRLGWRGILLTAAERLYGGEQSAKHKMQAAAASALAMRRKAEAFDALEQEQDAEAARAYADLHKTHPALSEHLHGGQVGADGVNFGKTSQRNIKPARMDMGSLMQTAAAEAGLHHLAFGFPVGGPAGEPLLSPGGTSFKNRTALAALEMIAPDAPRLALTDRTHRPKTEAAVALADAFAVTTDDLGTDSGKDPSQRDSSNAQGIAAKPTQKALNQLQTQQSVAEVSGGARSSPQSGRGTTPRFKAPRRVSMLGAGGAMDALVQLRQAETRTPAGSEQGSPAATASPPGSPIRPLAPARRARPTVPPRPLPESAGLRLPPLVTEVDKESASVASSRAGYDMGSDNGGIPSPPPTAPAGRRPFAPSVACTSRPLGEGHAAGTSHLEGRLGGGRTPPLQHPSTARPALQHGSSHRVAAATPPRSPGTPRRAPGSSIPHDFWRQGKKRRRSSTTRGKSRSSRGSHRFWDASGTASSVGQASSRSPTSDTGSDSSSVSAQFRGRRTDASPRHQSTGGRARRAVASATASRPLSKRSPVNRRRRGSASNATSGTGGSIGFDGIAVRSVRSKSPLGTFSARQRRVSFSTDGGGRSTGSTGRSTSLGLEAMLRAQEHTEHRDFLRRGEGPVSRGQVRRDRRESRVVRALEEGNADDISTALTGLRGKSRGDEGASSPRDLTADSNAPIAEVTAAGGEGGDDVHSDGGSGTSPRVKRKPSSPQQSRPVIRRAGVQGQQGRRAVDASKNGGGGMFSTPQRPAGRPPLRSQLASASGGHGRPQSGGRQLFVRTQGTPLRRVGSRLGARTAMVVGGRQLLGVTAEEVEAADVSAGSAGADAAHEAARAPAVAPFQHYLGQDGDRIAISARGKIAFGRPHLGGAGAAPNWYKKRQAEDERKRKSDSSSHASARKEGGSSARNSSSPTRRATGSPRMLGARGGGSSSPRMPRIRLDLSRMKAIGPVQSRKESDGKENKGGEDAAVGQSDGDAGRTGQSSDEDNNSDAGTDPATARRSDDSSGDAGDDQARQRRRRPSYRPLAIPGGAKVEGPVIHTLTARSKLTSPGNAPQTGRATGRLGGMMTGKSRQDRAFWVGGDGNSSDGGSRSGGRKRRRSSVSPRLAFGQHPLRLGLGSTASARHFIDAHVSMWQRRELKDSAAMRHAAEAITSKLSEAGDEGAAGGRNPHATARDRRLSALQRRRASQASSMGGSARSGATGYASSSSADSSDGGQSGSSRGDRPLTLDAAVGFSLDDETGTQRTRGGGRERSSSSGSRGLAAKGGDSAYPEAVNRTESGTGGTSSGKHARTNGTSSTKAASKPPPPATAKLVSRLGTVATTGALSGEAPTGAALRASIQDMSRRAAPSFQQEQSKAEWANRAGILSEQVLMSAARLPPNMRPVLPDPDLRRAMLKAMVSAMRVKFRARELPRWRTGAAQRQLHAMKIKLEDARSMMRMQSEEEMARAVAARFLSAQAARTRPPGMLMGLTERKKLLRFMEPFLDKAFEQATLSTMIRAAAGRGVEDLAAPVAVRLVS